MNPTVIEFRRVSAVVCDHGITISQPCRHCDRVYTWLMVRNSFVLGIPVGAAIGLLLIWLFVKGVL